jgi:hypothetical protein
MPTYTRVPVHVLIDTMPLSMLIGWMCKATINATREHAELLLSVRNDIR